MDDQGSATRDWDGGQTNTPVRREHRIRTPIEHPPSTGHPMKREHRIRTPIEHPPSTGHPMKREHRIRTPIEHRTRTSMEHPASSGHQLLGSKYREPKVVLKALPKSLLQKGSKRYLVHRKEARVTLKRLVNTKSKLRTTRVFTSKLHQQKAGLTKVSSPSSSSLQSALKKKELKVELEDISPSMETTTQTRRGKRKRVSVEDELDEPEGKCSRISPRLSVRKTQERKTKGDSRFDPDVMEKLFNFGAKVEEVLLLNKKAINSLTKDNKSAQSFSQMACDRLEDVDDCDFEKVLKWLEEEELHRKQHREKVLESVRMSHNTNLALYSHMLSVLQSVTASV
ncbi:hypothetical protein GWK47_037062 [Chionoecetes opilio]|uniref:Uncharacterized protein n=1 Tax=Chionoecetes opilio TaxID=41210 RepID=A0A8J4YSV2_CHIOP|nr:hypothetical protein GWK47_037062 [Chionoecetes opilio]